MARFGHNSLATLKFSLHWQDEDTRYVDRFLARRVNAWRDIFPPGLAESLRGLAQGQETFCSFRPGQLVPDHDPDRVIRLPRRAFVGRLRNGERVHPRLGRFYPQGMLEGLRGIYPSTMTPARVVDIDEDTIVVDLNHPLAGRDLQVKARVELLQDKQGDTGGQLSHWAEEICNNGPGMQTRLPGRCTDFFHERFFMRSDEDDESFYAQPRIIGHIDEQAQANLTSIHATHLHAGMRVLDLMSSVQTHVPLDLDLNITGLGMNREELQQNPNLDTHLVHDLNRDPGIPAQDPFDAVLLSLSAEYLIRPVEVLRSVLELLTPGGVILVGLSDRWFPTKAIQGWPELHEFERVGLVCELLHRAGFTGPMEAESIRNDWRPQSDRHFLATRGVSDPVYVVRARKPI